MVPSNYVSADGFRLGVWMSNLRAARKTRPDSFQVTQEHVERLDAIGMEWDARIAKWDLAYEHASGCCTGKNSNKKKRDCWKSPTASLFIL